MKYPETILICPACGKDAYRRFFAGKNFNLLKCRKCGLIRTMVQGETGSPKDSLYFNPGEAELHYKKQSADFRRYASELLDILPVKSGRLLDIGAGMGWVVAEAKNRGFEAYGIDPAKPYVEFGRRKLKVSLFCSTLEKFKSSKKYDVLVLKHVLEHVDNPVEFLKLCRNLLTPGGEILISCPNINSLMFFLFKSRWYGIQPEQHRFQFTPVTLSALLLNAGFIIEKSATIPLDYQPGNPLKKLFFTLTGIISSKFYLADQVILVARNPVLSRP